MPSKTQRERILAGGMSTVPPGDKLSEGTSSQLVNWRVDIEGQLTSRPCAVEEDGSPAGGGVYHTLRRTGDYRYSGIGSALFFGPGAGGTTSLKDGFDGNPLGIAFYQGHTWVMNRIANRQLRVDADQVRPWGVVAPPDAPVALLAEDSKILLEEFDGDSGAVTVQASADGLTFETPMSGDTPDPSQQDLCLAAFSADQAQSGSALDLQCQAGQTVLVRCAPLSVDTTGGNLRDDDTFRISIWLSDPTQLQSLTIALRNAPTDGAANQGPSVEVFCQPGSSWDVSKVLSGSAQAWTDLVVRRRLDVDAFQQQITDATTAASQGTGDYQTVTDLNAQLSQLLHQPIFQVIAGRDPQILSTNNVPAQPAVDFDWTAVVEMDITLVLSGACEVQLDQARFTGDEGVPLTGNVQYCVTFFNEILEEGNPSPLSDPLTVNGQPVQLTGIPVCGDVDQAPYIRGRYIYRVGAGTSQGMRVATLWDNSTTEWQDITSVDEAADDGIVVPVRNDMPPLARGCAGPYFGKILAWSTKDHPARLFWTDAGKPWAFYGAADPDVGNWEDAGDDSDELLTVTLHKQMAILYKQRSIWRLPGDPVTADPVQANSNVGLVGPNAVVSAGAIDYFVGAEGVYEFNGDYETKISGAIDGIFKNDYVLLGGENAILPIAQGAIGTCTLALRGDRLRLSYPEGSSSTPNKVLIYHVPSGRWMQESYDGLASPAFQVMTDEGPGRHLMGGTEDGHLYNIDAADLGLKGDNGNSYHVIWQSRAMDCGLADNLKVFSDVEIDYETSTATFPVSTLTVYVVFDNDAPIQVGTISSATRKTDIFRIPAIPNDPIGPWGHKAKRFSIRVEGDIEAFARIHNAYVHWYPEERIADTFDSGPTDLGMPERVKEADYVEAYMTGSGQPVALDLRSDLPGSVLKARQISDFNAPKGRGNVRFRLDSPVDGRNFRVVLANDPTGKTFQVHQARIRMRPIGEYIDGTINEYYESPEFSVAPGRVGELKDFLLDYDCSGGGGRVEVYSDLPGSSLSLRRTLPIPLQSGRGIYVFPMDQIPNLAGIEALPYGQLFKVRLYPPPGGVLRLHGRATFRARIIGVYFDGSQGELWETQPLDLVGGMAIHREVCVVAASAGPMTLDILTELPGQTLQLADSVPIAPPSAGRVPVFQRLKGNVKGMLTVFRLRGPFLTRLYEAKVMTRRLQVNGGAWDWVSLPVEPTPDGWAEIAMPVRATADGFEWVELGADPIE